MLAMFKIVVFLSTIIGLTTEAAGQTILSPEKFYSSHTLNIIVGSSPGGYYDTAARVIAQYVGKFIPGTPDVVVKNEPSAGGLAIANKLEGGVANDGATIVVMSQALPELALLSDPRVSFNPLHVTWLGSLSSYKNDGYLLVVEASNPVQSLDGARGGKTLNLGGTRAGSTDITYALLARDLLGLNIKVIRGFPGASEIWLAMDRNEVDGQFVDVSAIMVARPQAWRDKKLHALVAFGRKNRFPDLPDVPIARELIKSPDDLALLDFAELPFYMALPVAAPAGIPTDRARALKDGFMRMAKDVAFGAAMNKAGFLISPIDGDAVHALIERAAQTPPAIRARFARLLSAP